MLDPHAATLEVRSLHVDVEAHFICHPTRRHVAEAGVRVAFELRRLEAAFDGAGEGTPIRAFLGKCPTTALREAVELRFAPLWRDAPRRVDQPTFLEPIQGRIQRALVDLENIVGE